MGNDATSERFWTLDTAGVIKAVGIPVVVRKVVFYPGSIDDDILIQEYGADGQLRTAIKLKANHAAAEPITLDFGSKGRKLNGFKLATIDAGSLDVYIGADLCGI